MHFLLYIGYWLKIDEQDQDDCCSWEAEATTLRTDDAKLRPLLRMNLSFAGCGLLAIYHLGVAKMLATHGRRFMMNVQRFGGASAGALVASILAVRGCNLQVIEVSLDNLLFSSIHYLCWAFYKSKKVAKHMLGLSNIANNIMIHIMLSMGCLINIAYQWSAAPSG